MPVAPRKTEADGPQWVLYLLECRGGTLYAGITTDLERRFAEHASGRGARYTRSHPPVRVVASMKFPDRSAASKAEAALKKLPRQRKAAFFIALPAS
jgi:putative endonuclease